MTNQQPTSDTNAPGVASDNAPSSFPSIFPPLEEILANVRMSSTLAQFIVFTSILIGRAIIAPCEVLLRHRFGERYFSTPVVIISMVIGILLINMGDNTDGLGFSMIIVTATGIIINRLRCFLRDRNDQYWHSYYDGNSFLRFPKGEEWLARYLPNIDLSKQILEPLLLLLVSLILYLFSDPDEFYSFSHYFWGNIFVYYFLAAGIASFLYHYYAGQIRRATALDRKDAQVMLMVESAAAKAEPEQPRKLRHMAGVAFIPPSPKKEEA